MFFESLSSFGFYPAGTAPPPGILRVSITRAMPASRIREKGLQKGQDAEALECFTQFGGLDKGNNLPRIFQP